MSEKFIFGNANCGTIEVDPFTPICSHPDIGGSAPLTLDVPVPVFATPVPPNECACFKFTPKKDSGEVEFNCNNKKKITVEIKQATTDCCEGTYEINANAEIPCMPFEVDDVEVTVNKRDDEGRGKDGDAKLTLSKDCCSLKTELEITVPSCIKYYNKEGIPDTQITYYDNTGTQQTHKLIEMYEDESNCSIYPIITPLNLPPCMLEDKDSLGEGVIQTSTDGTQFKWKMTRSNCNIGLDFEVTPGTPPVIPLPCYPKVKGIDQTDNFRFKIAYKKNNEVKIFEPGTTYSAAYMTRLGTCPEFTLHSGTIDLTGVSLGGFDNGGDVNLSTEKKLRIDGDLGGEDTWFGAGYGDRADNDNYATTFSRGPIMRNNAESPVKHLYDGNGTYAVPVVEVGSAYQSESDTEPHVRWKSGRFPDNSAADVAASSTVRDIVLANEVSADDVATVTDPPSGDTGSSDDEEEETEEWRWESTADLDLVCTTGVQWCTRGLALTLTEFTFSDAGVLSSAEEMQVGVAISPAPAILEKAITKGGSKGDPASGLIFLPEDADESSRISSGLRVNAGDGLRIYGIGDDSVSTEEPAYDSTRQGALEIMYGPGFRIRGDGNDDTDLNYPVKVGGALMLNDGPGLRIHGQTKMGSETTVDDRKNKLEVMDGRGLRIHGYTKMGSESTVDAEKDKLEVMDGRGLRIHGYTKMGSESTVDAEKNKIEPYIVEKDFGFTTEGRIAINDAKAVYEVVCDEDNGFIRETGYECAIPTVCSTYSQYNYWTSDGGIDWDDFDDYSASFDVYRGKIGSDYSKSYTNIINALGSVGNMLGVLSSIISSFYGGYTHVSESGVVLAVNFIKKIDDSGVTRHITTNASNASDNATAQDVGHNDAVQKSETAEVPSGYERNQLGYLRRKGLKGVGANRLNNSAGSLVHEV